MGLFAAAHVRRTIVAVGLAGAVAAASAETGSFSCASGSLIDCSAATSTLSWSWNGSQFTIANNGSGYVSEVYFDLSGSMVASFQSGTGGNVLFVSPSNPGSLPGGNTVGFVSDIGFDSDAPGNPHNGIDQGETATFSITNANTGSIDGATLAAGIHVRSLPQDSASLVTAAPVPEPETYALLAAGLGAVGFVARRRKV
jgi:hypothetical protein